MRLKQHDLADLLRYGASVSITSEGKTRSELIDLAIRAKEGGGTLIIRLGKLQNSKGAAVDITGPDVSMIAQAGQKAVSFVV